MTSAKRSLSLFLLSLVLLFAALAGVAQARIYNAEEVRFVQLLNSYRSSHGLQTLETSGIVSEAGARHSLDMGNYNYFSHTSERSSYFGAGSDPIDRMASLGYPRNVSWSENIAAGQRTAQDVFNAWKNSPGHNANMLGSAYRIVGVARREVPGSPYEVYWTTDFGSVVDGSAVSDPSTGAPFSDVDKSDPELWNAAIYVKTQGYFLGYPTGAFGAWDALTHRHVALVMKRSGLGSQTGWETNYSPATRAEVKAAFPGLSWDSARLDETILRSQVVRLLYRARY
ncbi:MAG TPA: CAP domain-containing protein [Thermoleophilia bacterium]|nr:CAP domain-containing protein [Thermoleophilia bacterium]